MSKPKRARSERRQAERALRKEVVLRERLATVEPGGSRERAIVVSSASVVEGHARSIPCIQCGGELDLRTHAAAPDGEGKVRIVHLVCRLCHTPRDLWFRIERPLLS